MTMTIEDLVRTGRWQYHSSRRMFRNEDGNWYDMKGAVEKEQGRAIADNVREQHRATLNTPEPAPIPNDRRPVWDLVIEDMRARDNAGRAKYGTPLQAGNGRDPLVDAYQEALDLAVYLRQAIEERREQVIKMLGVVWCMGNTGVDPRERVEALLRGEQVETPGRQPWPFNNDQPTYEVRDRAVIQSARLFGFKPTAEARLLLDGNSP
jgi:hypothetical protein